MIDRSSTRHIQVDVRIAEVKREGEMIEQLRVIPAHINHG